jgi:hypothetical protein
LRFFDVRHELPDAWSRFQAGVPERRKRELDVHLERRLFPFLPGHREVHATRLELLFAAPDAEPSAHHIVEFLLGHGPDRPRDGDFDGRVLAVPCVASERWPGLFHGVLRLDRRLGQLGTFVFPAGLEPVREVFLFCGYATA